LSEICKWIIAINYVFMLGHFDIRESFVQLFEHIPRSALRLAISGQQSPMGEGYAKPLKTISFIE